MKKQHKGKSKIYLLCFDLSFYFNCLRGFNASHISDLCDKEHKNIKIQKHKNIKSLECWNYCRLIKIYKIEQYI